MKRIAFILVPVFLVLGLILAGCSVPNGPVGAPAARSTVIGTDGFDMEDIYSLHYDLGGMIVNLGNSDLNAGGEIFPILLYTQGGMNPNMGLDDTFVSYCAHAGSRTFAPAYTVAGKIDNPDLLAAFNYIYAVYGGNAKSVSSEVRLLSQIAVWNLYCDVPLDAMTANLPAAYKAAVDDVYANFRSYTGPKLITSLVLLLGTTGDIISSQPQLVPVFGETDGTITIVKTVNGINITAWASANGKSIGSLIASFDLYKDGVKVASSPVGADGTVSFTGLADGAYEVREVLTAAGALVFEQAPPVTITIVNAYQVGSGFDPSAAYESGAPGHGFDGVYNTLAIHFNTCDGEYRYNPWFEDFHVRVMGDPSKMYSSFCGAWYSGNLAPDLINQAAARFNGTEGALVKANVLKAFNYIYATWGSIDVWPYGKEAVPENATKVIAQMALWILLDDGVTSIDIDAPYGWINQYLADVLANYSAFNGAFVVTDLAYLARANFVFGAENYNQPQVVPIYGAGFNNTLKKIPPPDKITITGLNWNNGNTSNKDGANGAGLNQFTANGVTFKNNKEYVTPENFQKNLLKTSLDKKDNANMYTVTQRTTSQEGDKKADAYAPAGNKYEKVYDISVAMFANGAWKVYAGTITVDNPGGNDKNQKFDLVRIR